jgi:NarL family two-component system response regulator LiaR
MELIRVLLVDDHPIVRQGIHTRLQEAEEITVVGEASSGNEALRMVGESAPDVVLLDMVLPDLDGVEVTCRLREVHPEVRVLVFSGYDSDTFVFGVLEAGARGYLLKEEMPRRVVDAVRAVVQGQTVLSDKVRQRIVSRAAERETALQVIAQLSRREVEVLELVARFRTNEEIASALHVEAVTVEYHIRNILAKLGKRSRREAARWAWEEGIVAF